MGQILMIAKIRTMLTYCDLNKVRLQLSKCMFIVINGSDDDKVEIELDVGNIKAAPNVLILGSHLVETGLLKDDLKLHFRSPLQKLYQILQLKALPNFLFLGHSYFIF